MYIQIGNEVTLACILYFRATSHFSSADALAELKGSYHCAIVLVSIEAGALLDWAERSLNWWSSGKALAWYVRVPGIIS